MSERMEFGFERTICDCYRCSRFCKLYPGYMIPADLPRMMTEAGYTDVYEFARDHLEASLGAIAVRQGKPFRVQTLRPASLPNKVCHYLDSEGKCSIHEVSPYGCAFVDEHMSSKNAEERGRKGLNAVMQDKKENGIYTRVWLYLWHVEEKRGFDQFAKQWQEILNRRII